MRPLDLHDLVEQDGDGLGQAVEAVLGQEFRDLIQGGSLGLVGHRRGLLGQVGTFQGNRRWPAASRPGGFTERMMHYPLFGVRGVGHIRVFSEADGKRTPTADIYDKAGEVHVISHDKGWNLVTKGEEAYEWQDGEKDGLITKLNDK